MRRIKAPNETDYETAICKWLVDEGGYSAEKFGNRGKEPRDFDPQLGLDTAELFAFIGATQGDDWERVVELSLIHI